MTVDNITINGEEIESSGGMLLDIAGNLNIDVDGTTITLADDGVNFGQFYNNASGTFNIVSPTQDKDIVFRGNDGGSGIVALTLDMSDAGTAIFNSKIGIGVTNPAVTLELAGNGGAIRLPNGGELQFGNANNLILGNSGSNYLMFKTNNSEKVRIDSSGNVGIGTASPDSLLTMSASVPIIKLIDSDDSSFSRVYHSSGSLYFDADKGNGVGSSKIQFGVDDTERMRITSAGKVGIGTTSPNSMFEVRDNASPTIRVTDGDANNITHMQADGANGGYFGTLTSHDVRIAPNNSTKLIVKVDGKVGIGTTSPTKQLGIGGTGDISLEGSSNAIAFYDSAALKAYITSQSFGDHNGDGLGLVTSGDEPIKFFANGGERMRIEGDGKIGIGTSSPSTKLTIDEGGEPPAEGMLLLQANSSSRQLRIQPPTNADNGFLDYRGGNFVFLDDGTEVFRFQGTSEVVVNDGSLDLDFRVESNGNANMLHVNGGSNLVGIGGDPDLGAGLHIKIADSGATATAHGDELVIEDGTSGANVGISILSNANGEGRINFGDSNDNDIGGIYYEHDGDRMEFVVNNNEVMRILSSGNVGIGTSSPSEKLNVAGNILATGTVSGGTLSGVLQNGQRFENGAWYDSNEGKERFYFYNNGSSLWNTADAHLFQHNGSTKFTVDSGGNCTAVGNITAYSDERLKDNIQTIDSALDKVSQMRGVTFTKDDKLSSGVIAQEMEQVAPELVMDGEYKSVAYGNVVGYLIEAIKELKAEVEELKTKKLCNCDN